MKKILFISLLVFIIFLFGCSEKNKITLDESTESSLKPTSAESNENTLIEHTFEENSEGKAEPSTEKIVETSTEETFETLYELIYETTPEGYRYVTGNGRKEIVYYYSLRSYVTEDTVTVEALKMVPEDEDYLVTAEFNADRECISSDGLELVEITDISDMKGLYTSELKNLYGDFTTDIATGPYMPGYVTTDAYFVYFYLNSNDRLSEDPHDYKVVSARKLDLLTNEIVEEY